MFQRVLPEILVTMEAQTATVIRVPARPLVPPPVKMGTLKSGSGRRVNLKAAFATPVGVLANPEGEFAVQARNGNFQ